jgi:tRNA A-37 threonylcarbamoyl transferase component Bud32
MKNRYLDEGSYGCVIKPGIKCIKKIKKNTVSKYFIDKKEWLNELKNNKIINKFLKKEHIVKLIDYCSTIKKEKILIEKCKLLNKKTKYIYNIIYEYAGIDLYNLISKKIKFKEIFLKFDTIFETVKLLSDNNCIHFDIRLPNIVLKNKRLKLIDYGLMKSKNIENKYFKNKKENIYYLPPEFNNDNLNYLYIRIIKLIQKNNSIIFYNKKKRKQITLVINFILNKLKNKIQIQEIDKNKIDIYMIGIVLLELLIILNINNNLYLSDNEYNLILKFIKKLIEPNNKKDMILIKHILHIKN